MWLFDRDSLKHQRRCNPLVLMPAICTTRSKLQDDYARPFMQHLPSFPALYNALPPSQRHPMLAAMLFLSRCMAVVGWALILYGAYALVW